MSRNIIICCDGTNNQFGTENTNVVRLIQALDRDPERQRIYYDPGVGTLPEPGFVSGMGQRLSEIMGLAFGVGLIRKVGLAYAFLMREWRPGDNVFLFGFSRGAYTVRVLAGLLHMYGLLPAGNENLIPYVLRAFKASRRNLRKDASRAAFWKVSNEFRQTFAQPVAFERRDRRFPIHFMGVWDTVSSVGWIWEPARYPHTWSNPSVRTIRHAVSLDERRAFFRQNLFKPVESADGRQDLLELWFPGVHADVGGGYPENEGGLWREPFTWMLEEAKAHGLLIDPRRELAVLSRIKQPERPWSEPAHESLTWKWWPAEIFPKLGYGGPKWRRLLRLNLGRSRRIRERILLHPSVLRRQEELGGAYRPRALRGVNPWLIHVWRGSGERIAAGDLYHPGFSGGVVAERLRVLLPDLHMGDDSAPAERAAASADGAADVTREVVSYAPPILLESTDAIEPTTLPGTAQQEERYLQVQAREQKAEGELSDSLSVLKPGRSYLARVQVGAKSDDYFDPGQPLKLSEYGLFAVYFHDLGAGQVQKGQIVIGKRGTSTDHDFPFKVPADAKRFDARIVLSHQGRIVQAVILNATPNAEGDLAIALTVDVITPLVSNDSARSPTYDAALMLDRLSQAEMAGLLSTYAAAQEQASDGKVIRVGQATLNAVVTGVANAIRAYANNQPGSVALDSPPTEELLCKLAIHGNTLFENVLRPAGFAGARPPNWRLSIACSAESYFPAEIVYDRPVPLPNARLCQSFRSALETGRCCKEYEQRGGQVVCPLGFWGLSSVIERKCGTGVAPSPDEFRLMFRAATLAEGLRLGPALLGVSDVVNNVDATVSTQLTTAITQRYHRDSALVTNWADWQAAIAARRPNILVLLPHHLTDESLLEYLQIGVEANQNFFGHPNYLNSRHVTPAHVLAPQDGAPPIVLLIGCDTAKARIAFENFVVAFERAGAAGVVGTTAPIIGRHAGPAVEQLLLALRNKSSAGRPFGDVLLEAKRKIMLAGYPMVMCLASYGGVDHVLQGEHAELEVN